jgi:hypothetical protein
MNVSCASGSRRVISVTVGVLMVSKTTPRGRTHRQVATRTIL